MRIVRFFRLTVAAAALTPLLAAAQAPAKAPRSFDDSWFWGVRGGSTMFTTGAAADAKVSAPTVGAEWMITRSRVALYAAVEQAFFDNTAGVFDATAAGSVRAVSISDLRSYNVGLYFFPLRYGNLRPYAGMGLAINVIQSAEPLGTYTSQATQQAIFDAVNEQSSRVSAAFTAGAQYQVGRASLFGQVATMPTRRNFLINGAANTFVVQGGVRFNLLGAIEPLQ